MGKVALPIGNENGPKSLILNRLNRNDMHEFLVVCSHPQQLDLLLQLTCRSRLAKKSQKPTEFERAGEYYIVQIYQQVASVCAYIEEGLLGRIIGPFERSSEPAAISGYVQVSL